MIPLLPEITESWQIIPSPDALTNSLDFHMLLRLIAQTLLLRQVILFFAGPTRTVRERAASTG